MLTITEFCDRHDACEEGRAWALENCKDMQQVWDTIKPEWLVWTATRDGVLTDKEQRLFAVFCARQVEHLLTDQRSRDAIDVADRFARGLATDSELAAARDAAWAAAWASAMGARDAAWAAASAAALAAACASIDDAARATRAAAGDAASAAARDAQAEWLRANTQPNFEEVSI